ncbi:DUF485 domain-containing protein [Nocardioides jishulii]|uniref:DUF485 domain-containing protein n=1 Tax=Nocardioides jishulii TaxID=2575440 RepID=A0A4V5TR49_9ACTN|nr:DUF485 domain-containing protein [Nocardioides jishulii]QCX28791.1 DUF485 domain-containing protein [Nocardioides jishulii]TKI64313.1 DUF485 domain-containing protein [Nocardioides jishulii]
MSSPDRPERHDPIYDHLAAKDEFAQLRHLYRRFIIPATVVFLGWYALYVVMSMFASDFMNHILFGNINVALVFGLLQFVSTFGIAFLYSRYSNTYLDPLATQLREEYDAELAGRTAPGKTEV